MSIDSEKDVRGLLKIGKIVGLTLRQMQEHVRSGVTTGELDAIGAEVMRKHGARSAPIITYNFPGATCISLNEEAAHGIPGDRAIQEGDLVKLDVSAELDGYYADAAITVIVPPVSPVIQNLYDSAQSALDDAIAAARAGQPINQIGKAAETVARRHNLQIVRELTGHGVGRGLHEEPRAVPNFYMPQAKRRLTEGLVIAVEPHLTTGTGRLSNEEGWTLRTRDGKPVANFEHTIIVTNEQPILVTALA